MNIFLGFSFYGAGNIGDDLMLDGFIRGVLKRVSSRCNFYCCIDKNRIASQKHRFPEICWIPDLPQERSRLLQNADLWLGVGGTPFQGSSGAWLLEQIAFDLDQLPSATPAVMLGVGSENEVINYMNLANKIGHRLDVIFTRDQYAANHLVHNVGVRPAKVKPAGDLAHLALKDLFCDHAESATDNIGICFYQEQYSEESLRSLRVFVKSKSFHSPVFFFANETRRIGFERSLFHHLYGRRHWLRFWLNKERPDLLIPHYETGSLCQLVSHFNEFNTVLASRYHALVAAAWAGCRVAALGRSSKISNLAAEINIPIVSEPYAVSQLHAACYAAQKINRNKLDALCDLAQNSCIEVVQLIESLINRKSVSK